ncbi:MAG: hypothetical protein KDB79_07145 [Acidobacteria bacterium]|nr:hypothetical protein [Acidobacteriota bacterium]
MEKLFRAAVNDSKLVFRDSSLRLFFVFPILNLFVVSYGFPFVVKSFPVLEGYVNVLLMSATMQGALVIGFIYSMVLVDENDTGVAKVYGVLPVSQFWLVIFRLFVPFLFAALSAFAILIVEPFYRLSILSNTLYSLLCGLTAPMMVLFVAIYSKNKIEAMTWQKLTNIPISLPLLAFFVPASYEILFAVFPSYWVYQAFQQMTNHGNYALFLFVGYAFSLVILVYLARKFTRSHFS